MMEVFDGDVLTSHYYPALTEGYLCFLSAWSFGRVFL